MNLINIFKKKLLNFMVPYIEGKNNKKKKWTFFYLDIIGTNFYYLVFKNRN